MPCAGYSGPPHQYSGIWGFHHSSRMSAAYASVEGWPLHKLRLTSTDKKLRSLNDEVAIPVECRGGPDHPAQGTCRVNSLNRTIATFHNHDVITVSQSYRKCVFIWSLGGENPTGINPGWLHSHKSVAKCSPRGISGSHHVSKSRSVFLSPLSPRSCYKLTSFLAFEQS